MTGMVSLHQKRLREKVVYPRFPKFTNGRPYYGPTLGIKSTVVHHWVLITSLPTLDAMVKIPMDSVYKIQILMFFPWSQPIKSRYMDYPWINTGWMRNCTTS